MQEAAARLASWAGGPPNPVIGIIATTLLVIWCCVEDWRRSGRVHAAYRIAGTLLILSLPGRLLLGRTEAWQRFAQWLVS